MTKILIDKETVKLALEALELAEGAMSPSKNAEYDYEVFKELTNFANIAITALRQAIEQAQKCNKQCGVCGENQAFTGTCGGGRDKPNALCFESHQSIPQKHRRERMTKTLIDKETVLQVVTVMKNSQEYKRGNASFVETVEDIEQALEQDQPVAKFVRIVDGIPCITLLEHRHLLSLATSDQPQPQEAAPTKPLTDEKRKNILAMWSRENRNYTVADIIDAVEAAHGIKGEA